MAQLLCRTLRLAPAKVNPGGGMDDVAAGLDAEPRTNAYCGRSKNG
jgi:hypothetical protein